MSRATIKDVELAILKAIRDDSALSYVPDAQVQTVSARNVDFATNRIIIHPPAVLVYYPGGTYEPVTTPLKRYRADYRFILLALVRNLRSDEAAKHGGPAPGEKGAYDLLEDLKLLFAGKELALPSPARATTVLARDELIEAERGLFLYELELALRNALWDAVG